MTLRDAKSSLDTISKTLAQIQDDREFLLKNTREIVILCSKSIIASHSGDSKNAKIHLKRASNLLTKYRKKTKGNLVQYMVTPEQEYVEAVCLISILEKKPILSHKKLGVMPESYVLGLLDCVGELKRVIFDKIRTDQIKEASRVFDIMEKLYMYLYKFAMYDKVVKETRRKIDVNRRLVDDVRGAITEEESRRKLIGALSESKE